MDDFDERHIDPVPLTDQRGDGRIAATIFVLGIASLAIVAVVIASIVRYAQGLM